MHETITIVEDDPDILKLVAHTMEKAGYHPRGYPRGKDFLNSLASHVPDVVILDLMLPDMDGLEICRTLRNNPATHHVPVLILTAKGDETDKVLGLELGADDYVTKPFSSRELVARVKVMLRRRETPVDPAAIRLGESLVIDPISFEVLVDGVRIELTSTEFRLLQILAEKKGRVFSRDQLLTRLWGSEKMVLDRTIDVHVKNLRDKLGQAGTLVKSIRGVGYKIEE